MKVSVIIPTYNGAHKIMNALRSLETQSVKPHEVIVIIDGSTDGTAELLRNEHIYLESFRTIEQENSGRAGVRNKGVEESTGQLLIFLDDDIIAPPEWVGEHIKHHASFPGSILTGTLREPQTLYKNDFFHFKTWLHHKWTKDMKSLTGSSLLTNPYITANNMSLPRTIFNILSGFDSRLTDAEDYDLATRAMNANIPLYISPLIFAYNNDIDNIDCERYLKRLRSYTYAQQKLIKLKPELYNNSHQYSTPQLSGLKSLIFASLAKRWWIRSVDNEYWVWLPKSLRFKLYDLIITANGTFFPEKVNLD